MCSIEKAIKFAERKMQLQKRREVSEEERQYYIDEAMLLLSASESSLECYMKYKEMENLATEIGGKQNGRMDKTS